MMPSSNLLHEPFIVRTSVCNSVCVCVRLLCVCQKRGKALKMADTNLVLFEKNLNGEPLFPESSIEHFFPPSVYQKWRLDVSVFSAGFFSSSTITIAPPPPSKMDNFSIVQDSFCKEIYHRQKLLAMCAFPMSFCNQAHLCNYTREIQ